MLKARNAGKGALLVCLQGCLRTWFMFIIFLVQYAGKVFYFLRNLVENARFGSVGSNFLQKSGGNRSFWKASFSVFAKVSWKTLVLEAWILTFLQKSRGKRLFFVTFLPLVCWKVQFVDVAVTLGFAVSFFCMTRCATGRLQQRLRDFSRKYCEEFFQ